MNRIYKVIYSKARQCSIVVSEFAKSSHKNSRKGASHTGTPALARILAAALVAGAVTWGVVPEVSWAADNTTVTDSNGNEVTNTDSKKDINANITGKNNKVIDSSNAEIVGDGNTVTNEVKDGDKVVAPVRSDDARIVGSNNAISGSRNQQVIGDNNQIIGRDDVTVSEGEENVSDLTIGSGNFIRSKNTGRNKWDSLKVIGNNNRADMEIVSAGGPAAGIVIGDNQNIDNIKDSIVIGSLSPDEQKEQVGEDGYKSDKYTVGLNSVVVGYHATSSKDASTVIGNRSKVSGSYQTVTGLRSTIEGNYYNNKGFNLLDGQSGNFASIYGSFNKIEDATGEYDMDGVGNSINGSMNVTSNARGTMIMGVGNTVTHSKGEFLVSKDDDSGISTRDLLNAGVFSASDYALGRDITGDNLTYPADQTYAVMRDAWQRYMETSGGAVSVLGNSNTSDYVIRSQILGTNNMLKGSEDNISSYNTISGFSNTGTNVKRTAIVGTGNNLTNGVDNVVIGDYHNLENGKHNVILGSMASEEKAVTKTAKAAWAATDDDNPDGTYTYTVNEQVALKPNTKNIENAVMVGYNTDVTQNGGVALGSDSVASTKVGETGYDALGKTHNNSDKDYSAWVSTGAAVSVGRAEETDKEGKVTAPAITRQITNVAAGTQDTDAVNVAQLKSALSGAKGGNDTLKSDTNALALNGNTLSMSVEDTAGHKVSGSVDLSQLAKAVDTNTTYTLTGEANPDNNTTTITLSDNSGNKNSVTVATKDTDTRNTVKAGENVTLDTKDNADGSHEYTVNVKADGKVEAGSTKIVSGDTVYNETRVKQDGTYVKVSNTAGENLSALDNQVTSNTQNINYLNGRVGELGDRINKVGAGAAALAALHPLDFDPEDKWDFAAGVGNYRNATAAAVGLFYRPNERTMFNLGWTMGDNRNMVNGGFSLKFGKSNKYIKYSKAEMASVIDKQSREIAELKARDVQNAKDKAEMKADNAEMKAEIEALKKQVEALAAKK